MTVWGILLGGAAGLALGGPLGALLGAAAGHAVGRVVEGTTVGREGDATQQVAFTIGVIALGAKMAKADGHVSRDEVSAFREVFRVPPGEESNVGRIFNLARRSTAGYQVYARQVAGMFRDRKVVLEELLACLMHIAKADGPANAAELAYLRDVARIFRIDETTFERLCAAHLGTPADDPYRILGIGRDASDEAVRAAYRRLVREHHPDRLIAQGVPEEAVGVATERMAAINAAYDRVREARPELR